MNKLDCIYVAGHEGLVGKNLMERLQIAGYENILTHPRSYCDLRMKYVVDKIFATKNIDCLIICAAKVGGIFDNMNNQYSFLLENLEIQNNLISAAINTNVKRVIFLGSSCVYPKDYTQPLKEEYLLAAKPEPTNEGYSIAKIAGVKLCEYANQLNKKTKFTVLIPCNIYGKYDHFDNQYCHVIPALIRRFILNKESNTKQTVIWGSGLQKREFIYAEDVADCIVWAISNDDILASTINVGVDNDYTIREIAFMIKEIIGYSGEIVFDSNKPEGMMVKKLDTTEIKKLGWSANTDMYHGLKKTICWYLENKNKFKPYVEY